MYSTMADVFNVRPFTYFCHWLYNPKMSIYDIKVNDQSQVFRFLYAIWPKSKDLYPTYLKATKPPRDLRTHPVSIKFARLAYIDNDFD